MTVNYVMTLGIATLLLTGLLMSTGSMMEDRRETAMRSELEVIGQRLAAGIQSADRLAEAGGQDVAINVSLPSRVAGKPYQTSLEAEGGSVSVVLVTTDPSMRVTVPVANTTPVESTTVTGGDARVVLAGDGDLEVRNP